jgi:phage gp46-like protein
MDAALVFDSTDGTYDLALEAADLQADDGLLTAVVVSLFSDARAPRDVRLPAESTDRRGFWGDSFAQLAGDQTGSLLWLLDRELNIERTRAQLEERARDALAWLVEDGIATRVDAVGEILDDDLAALQVEIYEPRGTRIDFRFSYVWEAV